jgi:excisionase family DNA binding protein
MAQPSPPLRLYDAKEIATLLGLHLRTVQVMFKTGKLRGMKVGRNWKAYQSDIDAYLQAQRQIAAAVTGKEPL